MMPLLIYILQYNAIIKPSLSVDFIKQANILQSTETWYTSSASISLGILHVQQAAL